MHAITIAGGQRLETHTRTYNEFGGCEILRYVYTRHLVPPWDHEPWLRDTLSRECFGAWGPHETKTRMKPSNYSSTVIPKPLAWHIYLVMLPQETYPWEGKPYFYPIVTY